MIEYEDLWGGKRSVVILTYKNKRQLALTFKNGARMDAHMLPISAVKEMIIEIQQAIEDTENGRIA